MEAAGRSSTVSAAATAFRGGTIDPLLTRAACRDDGAVPGYLLLILVATAFVVVLCLALWVLGEATGGPNLEHDESDRPQADPAGTRHARNH